MTFLTRCDRCGAEREPGKLTGWSHVTLFPSRGSTPGRLIDSKNLDYCPDCTDRLIEPMGAV